MKQLKLYKYSRGDDKVPVEFVRGAMLGKVRFLPPDEIFDMQWCRKCF
jgi:hypothetical protein